MLTRLLPEAYPAFLIQTRTVQQRNRLGPPLSIVKEMPHRLVHRKPDRDIFVVEVTLPPHLTLLEMTLHFDSTKNETAAHITSTVKSRENDVFVFSTQLVFFTLYSLGPKPLTIFRLGLPTPIKTIPQD